MKRNAALKFTGLFFAFGIVFCLTGCKTAPADKQVFIPPEYVKMMESKPNHPMGKSWGKQEEIRKYDKIQVAVIIHDKQLEASSWAESNIRNMVSSKEKDLNELAKYTSESFKKAFGKSKKLKLVDKPGPETLALEFAIVQAVPNKPILGAISNLSNLTPIGAIISPIKISASDASEGNGVIAMEVILRDSESGQVVAVVADRVKCKSAFFNTKNFTAYGGARQVVDMWTSEIVTALDQIRSGEKVDIKSRETFSFFN